MTICLIVISCGTKNTNISTSYTARQIAEIILAAQTNIPALVPLTAEDDMFAEYVSLNYSLESDGIKDGAVFYAFGVEASEITVLLFSDSADAKKAADALEAYKERRTAALTGYAPVQADLAERGLVVTRGAYAALFICDDTGSAESAFLSCFSEDPPGLPDAPLNLTAMPSADAPIEIDETRTDGTPADVIHVEDTQTDQTRQDESPADENQTDTEGEPERDGDDAQQMLPGQSAESDTDPRESAATPAGHADDGISPPEQTANAPTPDADTDKQQPGGLAENSDPAAQTGDPYNAAAILEAWNSGDTSALTQKNKAIHDACAAVIREIIADDMTEFEKELAIHDWIVLWASYDIEANNNSPNAKPTPDNDNPYGLLFKRKAICSGYTSTFQLFMDMLEIECITVNGYARNKATEHAWNMVRINGQWYCVDVTWDDPTGAYQDDYISHEYFNVTSQHLRNSLHIWDETGVPEATATDYGRGNTGEI